jgi:O-glycosyl hydrolase
LKLSWGIINLKIKDMLNSTVKPFVIRAVFTLLLVTQLAFSWNAYSQNSIQVNKQTPKQTIWGFGGAANHPVENLKKNLSVANQNIVLDKLFRTDNDNAGLSIVRLEINAFRRTDTDPNGAQQYTFQPSDGVWDWDTDLYQRWFSEEAAKRSSGVHFMAVPWSPPGWMKSNNSPINGGSLKAENYDKFAEYMKTYVDRYRNTYGIDIRWISVQNEPTNSTPYASCTYTNSAMNIVAAKVADAVHSLDQGVLVGAPEGATRGISVNFMNAMSAATKSKLDYILTHDYTGANNSLAGFGKPVINTEVWSEAGSDDLTITDGIRWARAIRDALVNRNEPGWLYWWIIDPYAGAQGIIVIKSNGTYTFPKRLYAMGQFSRFMRKGDVRVEATSTNSQLEVVATKNDEEKASILVINNSTSAITSTLRGLTSGTLEVYRTSATESLTKLPEITTTDFTASVTFPAKSITTLIETSSCLNAAPTISAPDDKTYEAGTGVQTIDLIGIGDGDECTQGVTLTVTSSNPAVVSIDSVDYTSCNTEGSLQITPLTRGTALITVTAVDGGAIDCGPASKTVSFTVNVTQTINLPAKIEAEDYADFMGIETQETTDEGGGQNVGWVNTDDWMTYIVNIEEAGTFSVDFRVAGWATTGRISLQDSSFTTLTSATIPNGGAASYQVWSTVPGENKFTLQAGKQTIRIFATGEPWNLNWFEIKSAEPSVLTSIVVTPATKTLLVGETQQFVAAGVDQTGYGMIIEPSWTVEGGGTIDASTGLFSATTAGGPYTITANANALSGSATVSIYALTSLQLDESYFNIVNQSTAGYLWPKDSLANAIIAQYASATPPENNSCKWEFVPAPTEGAYHILNKHTGRAIQPKSASIAENSELSQIVLTTSNKSKTELQWNIIQTDEATSYWIQNLKSGLYIHPVNGEISTGISMVQNSLIPSDPSFKWNLVNKGLKDDNSNSDAFSTNKKLIYTNPVIDNLRLDMHGYCFSRLEIADLTGRIHQTIMLNTDQSNYEINLSEFKQGIYILKFSNDLEIITHKLVKK